MISDENQSLRGAANCIYGGDPVRSNMLNENLVFTGELLLDIQSYIGRRVHNEGTGLMNGCNMGDKY